MSVVDGIFLSLERRSTDHISVSREIPTTVHKIIRKLDIYCTSLRTVLYWIPEIM